MYVNLIGAAFTFAAVIAIYQSWRQKRNPKLALLGWSLAVASLFIWSWVQGPEFGVTYAMIVFILGIWVAVITGTDKASPEGRIDTREFCPLSMPSWSAIGKHSALFLLSVPAVGVLSVMLTVAVLLYLPWTLLNKLAVAIFLYPLLWGALGAWTCTYEEPLKPALVSAGLFLVSSPILFA